MLSMVAFFFSFIKRSNVHVSTAMSRPETAERMNRGPVSASGARFQPQVLDPEIHIGQGVRCQRRVGFVSVDFGMFQPQDQSESV